MKEKKISTVPSHHINKKKIIRSTYHSSSIPSRLFEDYVHGGKDKNRTSII